MRREIEEEIISKIFENPRERVPSRAEVKRREDIEGGVTTPTAPRSG